VIAEAVRRSALADYAERFSAIHQMTGGAVSVRELPFLTQINLRVDPHDGELMTRLRATLGLELPQSPNTTTANADRRALWLGPDEWLLVAPEGQLEAIDRDLRNGLSGAIASLVDVSANRTMLEIAGPGTIDLLARGIPIDLHARSFRPGSCAQTLLAKAQVIIERRSDSTEFHLYVRGSFARYAADWLIDASLGLG
jgi:sarcosine oxidase, subunit gamma